jgi:hypothetical protein
MTTHPDHQAFGFAETRHDPDTRKPIGTLAHRGLSKREYFAALAMQGFCGNSGLTVGINEVFSEVVAQMSVEHADALIAALNGEGQANG